MTIRLVALDLDHTLLNNKREISREDLEAINRARAQGVVFTIATGRMFAATKTFGEKLNIDVPIITYQGSLIKRLISEEEIRHLRIPNEIAKQGIRLAKDNDVFVNVYNGDDLYVFYENDLIKRYREVNGVHAIVDEDLCDKLNFNPTKIVFVEDDLGKLDGFQKIIETEFSNLYDITRSLPHLLELGHIDATKSNALSYIANILNIKQSETMAIGDGLNDIDMLHWANVGVAMGNALDAVKKSADWVTDDNNSSGVAKAIEKFILKAQ
jgi:hypothetical protein